MSDGIALIAAERRRQVEEEGWTLEHDAGHRRGELALAAACYAIPPREREERKERGRLTSTTVDLFGALWPWWNSRVRGPTSAAWWKPTPEDRVRELVKAGALIAVEIDRLQRAAGAEKDSFQEIERL